MKRYLPAFGTIVGILALIGLMGVGVNSARLALAGPEFEPYTQADADREWTQVLEDYRDLPENEFLELYPYLGEAEFEELEAVFGPRPKKCEGGDCKCEGEFGAGACCPKGKTPYCRCGNDPAHPQIETGCTVDEAPVQG